MTKLKTLSVTLLVVTVTYSSSSYADWDSFVDDIITSGKQLLSDTPESTSALNYDTVVAGLKEALEMGSRYAVTTVSQKDGYLSNELIRIAMPPQLQQASDLMRQFGLSAQADQFEQSMNHAAEKAAPQATNIIVDAIKNMSIEDANNILHGSDDAATHYFKKHTSTRLAELFNPTIENSLNQVGTTKYYNDLTKKIASLPLVGETINLDLADYVTEQALSGLFTMIALEEKKIRDNPTARTTELLKQVFGNQ